MAKNVVGLFDTSADAQAALQDLRNAGFTQDQVSFVANNQSGEYDQYATDAGSSAAEGAGAGATTGTVVGGIGGLLAGLGLLAIPGIGPLAAAGTLAGILGGTAAGAGIGAAAGGLVGALVGAGIPDEDANVYSEGVRRGGTLLMVQADDQDVDRAADIMNRHNVVDIDERGASYRSGGWSGFNENAGQYNSGTATTTGGEYRDTDTGDNAYAESSKLGTATGGVAGAATGAAIGSVGGPVGTVVGGVAGALAGGGVGAAGDAIGAEATDDDGRGAVMSERTDTDVYDSSSSAVPMGSTTGTTTTVDTTYGGSTGGADAGYADSGMRTSGTGDADTGVGGDDYARSSKVGTAGGGLAGAATGAAIGSAGGPVGTVIGGVAGALAGGGVGAAGDAAGAEATDDDADRGGMRDTSSIAAGTAYGSATDVGTGGTNVDTTYNTGTTGTTRTTDYDTTRASTVDTGDTVAVPIVEEELRVGKREVETGGVRVNVDVEEVPVQEQVTLREEHVEIERRPVNRAVTDADLANLQDATIEVRERHEEAIVDKQARVVEEVVIRKEVEERTETIQDTVRRTEVDVEQVPGTTRTTGYTTTDTTSTTGYTTGTTDVNYGTTGTTGTTDTGERRSLTDRIEDATNTDLNRDGDVGGNRRM